MGRSRINWDEWNGTLAGYWWLIEEAEKEAADHGPLCFKTCCMPAEQTVIVEDISGVVVAVPVSEVPEF